MDFSEKTFSVRDYDLAATLQSGQAFRWQQHGRGWIGIVNGRWLSLATDHGTITARAACPDTDWSWLAHYLQIETDLDSIIAGFPADDAMRSAIAACACCARTRGNASPPSSFPRPNKSSRSGRSLRCFAGGLANRSPCLRATPRFTRFPRPNGWRWRLSASCAIVKWAFARRTFSP